MGHDMSENAFATCTSCGTKVDKGIPADHASLAGQDDGTFVCADCTAKRNAAATANE